MSPLIRLVVAVLVPLGLLISGDGAEPAEGIDFTPLADDLLALAPATLTGAHGLTPLSCRAIIRAGLSPWRQVRIAVAMSAALTCYRRAPTGSLRTPSARLLDREPARPPGWQRERPAAAPDTRLAVIHE